MGEDETNDEQRAKIVQPGELMPDQNLTVDHDSWMDKDISGSSSPDTVWTMSDGTQIRPAELPDFLGSSESDEPEPGA